MLTSEVEVEVEVEAEVKIEARLYIEEVKVYYHAKFQPPCLKNE